MGALLYFLIWAAFIFFMMRWGFGAHVTGHRHGFSHGHGDKKSSCGNVRWLPPEKDVDPVCGMTVETAKAKSAVHGGHVYYFCSQDCREKFEAAPASYLQLPRPTPQKKEHSHEQ
jgi:YHS domain-containing protein